MNIPFRFALNTSTKPYGRLFDYTAAGSGYDMNNTLYGIATATGLAGTAAAKLALAGIVIPARTTGLWVTGLSLDAWFATDIAAKVDFGVYDTGNAAFIPLYECVATAVPGAGIQKTFGSHENGIFVPVGATLLPAFRATKQTATDGAVTVAGDVHFYIEPTVR